MTRRFPVRWILLTLVATGCAPSGPVKFPVTGTVTWNGQPLPDGQIVFHAADNALAPDAATIVDGEFSANVQPGMKRITIMADRVIPGAKVDPVMQTLPREPYIPERYNAKSILKEEVKRDGPNRFVFDLTGKP